MTSTAEAAIAQVVETVDYLRVGVGPLDDEGWHSCRRMLDDPDLFAGIVQSARDVRGLERHDVAMSIFVQGYSYRIASVAIGAWLLGGVVLDVSPDNMAFRIKEGRPREVRFGSYRTVDGPADLGTLHEVLVDGHLILVADSARKVMRIGRSLLWANIGSSCAASFGAFMSPLPDQHTRIRQTATDFFNTARPELVRSGRVVPVGQYWAWERRACCLWYKSPVGTRCSDCSLWTPEERRERYDRVSAEVCR